MAFEPRPDQIVVDVGGEALLRYGTWTRRLATIARGGEEAKETHTRASKGTFVDRDGVGKSAGVDKPRVEWIKDANGLYQPHLLLEAARTQLVTDPENFGAWTLNNAPTLTSGQADPFGGTAAYLINDDSALVEHITQVLTFTGDGTKALALFVRQGTSDDFFFGIFDDTAVVWRHHVKGTWTAGVPALSTAAGGGTLFPIETLGGSWFRVMAGVNGIVAANSHRFFIGPTQDLGADTGTTYFFGANAWNATFPSSYQGPSLASRSADRFSQPLPYKPQQMWGYGRLRERGTRLANGDLRSFQIGKADDTVPKLTLFGDVSGFYRIHHETSSGVVNSTVSAAAQFGDDVEVLWTIDDAGKVQLRQALNGGADNVGAQSGALSLANAWSDALFWLNSAGTTAQGFNAFRRVVVGLGALPANIQDVRSFLAQMPRAA